MRGVVAVGGLLADCGGLGAVGPSCLLGLRVRGGMLRLSAVDVGGARVLVLEVLLTMPHRL